MRTAMWASATLLVGCVAHQAALNPSSTYRGQIPIAVFDNYEPYNQTGIRDTDSYVAFRDDGVLTVSMGCTIYSSGFGFDDESLLILTDASEGVAISNPVRDCDESLMKTEATLWTFLNSQPVALGWIENSLILRSGRKILEMQSVADVLGEGVKMKEEL